MRFKLKRDIIFFITMISLVLLLWIHNTWLTITLIIEFSIALVFYTSKEKLFFLISGLFGVILESIGSYIGIWSYTLPNFITIPIWIFFCWGFTFMMLNSIYQSLNKSQDYPNK